MKKKMKTKIKKLLRNTDTTTLEDEPRMYY